MTGNELIVRSYAGNAKLLGNLIGNDKFAASGFKLQPLAKDIGNPLWM